MRRVALLSAALAVCLPALAHDPMPSKYSRRYQEATDKDLGFQLEADVEIEGQWVQTSPVKNGQYIYPHAANAFSIKCFQRAGACVMSIADVRPGRDGSPSELVSNVLVYTVQSWTPAEIVAVRHPLAADDSLHIDRTDRNGHPVRRSVTQTRSRGGVAAEPGRTETWAMKEHSVKSMK